MILPVYTLVRSRAFSPASTRAFGLAPGRSAGDRASKRRRAERSATWPCPSRSSSRAGCARRRGSSRRSWPPALGQVDGVARVEAAPNGYLNFFLDRRRVRSSAAESGRRGRGAGVERQDHRRAHGDQPEQGGAHRPPAQRGARRHARAAAPLPGARRSKCRTTSTTPACRSPTSSSASPSSRARDLDDGPRARRRPRRASTTTAGISTRGHRVVRRRQGAARDARRRRCTTSSTAATTLAAMGAFIADRIVRCHLKTMARLNIDYDLLTWEGDILRLQFWATAFELLKAHGAVFLQTEGRLAGCWVMPIEDGRARPPTPTTRAGDDDPEQREKVIVRSNGTVTYVGKDIANQFWKFGLLGRDFHYRVFDAPRRPAALGDDVRRRARRRACRRSAAPAAVYNVIDSRQSYLQKLLKQALADAGLRRARRSARRTSRTRWSRSRTRPRASSATRTADSERQAVRRSVGPQGPGREGRRPARSADRRRPDAKSRTRNPELAADERRRTAEAIAVAAVRYFMVKFSRGKVIAFDIDEALSFEGETGPYLQYAVVRANNILAKLRSATALDEAAVVDAAAVAPADAARRGRRGRRALGPGARSRAARRDRRPRRCAIARVLGAREVRVRPGAGVQRLLPPAADPARKSARTRASGAPPPSSTSGAS